MNKNESKYFNTAYLMEESLLSLLDKKDYEYITVKEICQKAGVNRSTFYLHYETIDDLLKETIETISKKFYESFGEESTLDISQLINSNDKDNAVLIQDRYLYPYLEFVKDNQKVFRLNFKKPQLFKSDKFLNNMFNQYFVYLLDYFKIEKSIQKYVVDYYLQGMVAIIKRWVYNDCIESIEKVIDIIKWCTRIDERKDN
jgi:AcrR family transcriptional regulator